MFLFLAVLPFWSNYLIRTYAWIVLLNREGLITQLLRWFGYTGEPLSMLYTEFAVIAGLVYNYLPFVILAMLRAAVAARPASLPKPRAISAPRRSTTFRRVILPLTVPGIAAGAVFVFVLSIGNFVTPALLGGGRFQMIGNLIYDQFLTANDWPFGAALSHGADRHHDAGADGAGNRRRPRRGRRRRRQEAPMAERSPATRRTLWLVLSLVFAFLYIPIAVLVVAVLQRRRAADGLDRLLAEMVWLAGRQCRRSCRAALNTLIVALVSTAHRHAARHAAGDRRRDAPAVRPGRSTR